MTAGQLVALGKLLRGLDENTPTREYALYMRSGPPWTVDTESCILSRDIYSDELPPFARAAGLKKILSADQVLDVVENARLQKGDVSESELVAALAHYHQRDAFINFSL